MSPTNCLTGNAIEGLILPTFNGINVKGWQRQSKGHKAAPYNVHGGQPCGRQQKAEEAMKNTLSVTPLFRKCKKKIFLILIPIASLTHTMHNGFNSKNGCNGSSNCNSSSLGGLQAMLFNLHEEIELNHVTACKAIVLFLPSPPSIRATLPSMHSAYKSQPNTNVYLLFFGGLAYSHNNEIRSILTSLLCFHLRSFK